MLLQKARCNASAASVSTTRSVTADMHPGVSFVGAPISPVDALPRGTASVLWLRGKLHSELPWLYGEEGSEGGSCKACARMQPKERRHRPTCRS